ncbi:hypothetical protein GCM10027282_06980 [Frigoribacterium salinisoli]
MLPPTQLPLPGDSVVLTQRFGVHHYSASTLPLDQASIVESLPQIENRGERHRYRRCHRIRAKVLGRRVDGEISATMEDDREADVDEILEVHLWMLVNVTCLVPNRRIRAVGCTERCKTVTLSCEILPRGRDAGVSDEHEATAAFKPPSPGIFTGQAYADPQARRHLTSSDRHGRV